jgi:hypothetical protein
MSLLMKDSMHSFSPSSYNNNQYLMMSMSQHGQSQSQHTSGTTPTQPGSYVYGYGHGHGYTYMRQHQRSIPSTTLQGGDDGLLESGVAVAAAAAAAAAGGGGTNNNNVTYHYNYHMPQRSTGTSCLGELELPLPPSQAVCAHEQACAHPRRSPVGGIIVCSEDDILLGHDNDDDDCDTDDDNDAADNDDDNFKAVASSFDASLARGGRSFGSLSYLRIGSIDELSTQMSVADLTTVAETAAGGGGGSGGGASLTRQLCNSNPLSTTPV